MLDTVYFDAQISDSLRREQLFNGRLFVFSPRPSTIALSNLRAPWSRMPLVTRTQKCAVLDAGRRVRFDVAPLKPAFIHHPTTRNSSKMSSTS